MPKLLFIILTICILSCTKTVEKLDITSNVTGPKKQSSAMESKSGTGRLPISMFFYHNFRGFWRDCYSGTWYCWPIGSPSDNKSFIEINEENQLIIFGIDNRDSFCL